MAFSGTALMLSVWWSWQLAGEVPRDLVTLSRAGPAEVLLKFTSNGFTRFRSSDSFVSQKASLN